ncbi:MAG: NAAT family transporter [Aphanocapsa sp. GSE-SYN-MK-11-07L]|jgi:multiple antibiotic resistance protein|nr:NAAT family transporter [Aphanocapsa sp. GSE-SYN-MK-11-07L]
MTTDFLKTFMALFTITNPIGNIPLFLALTAKQSLKQKRQVIIVAAIAVMVTLIISLFVGKAILDTLSIQLAAFELAGQTIIATLAWSMLHAQTSGQRHTPEEQAEATTKDSIAIVPLAIPILAGPGAMSTVISYASRASGSQHLLAVLVILAVTVTIAVCFLLAPMLQKVLGVTGMNVLTRVFGLLLLAISIGSAANALKELFPMLGKL